MKRHRFIIGRGLSAFEMLRRASDAYAELHAGDALPYARVPRSRVNEYEQARDALGLTCAIIPQGGVLTPELEFPVTAETRAQAVSPSPSPEPDGSRQLSFV